MVRIMTSLLIILFCQSQIQVAGSHHFSKQIEQKLAVKDYSVNTGILPSATKIEVINQEFPWSEEIHFRVERVERPVVVYSSIVRIFFLDLLGAITPSHAP